MTTKLRKSSTLMPRYLSAITAFCIVLGCRYAKAQSVPETRTWLMGRLASHCGATAPVFTNPDFSEMYCSSITLMAQVRVGTAFSNPNRVVTKYNSIHLISVTNVVQRPVEGAIAIVFLGPSLADCDAVSDDCQRATNLTLYLLPSTPQPEVDRIVKAFKHLAEGYGAKISSDDDLFK